MLQSSNFKNAYPRLNVFWKISEEIFLFEAGVGGRRNLRKVSSIHVKVKHFYKSENPGSRH